jgi:hypothetical protein
MWVRAGSISIDIDWVCVDESRTIAARRPETLHVPHSSLLTINALWEKKTPGPKARRVKQGGFTSGRRGIRDPEFRARPAKTVRVKNLS